MATLWMLLNHERYHLSSAFFSCLWNGYINSYWKNASEIYYRYSLWIQESSLTVQREWSFWDFHMLFSLQDLLMDLRDKLLFEPEYAGNIKEKIPPKFTLRIPWAWLPGALCLLQEVIFWSLLLQAKTSLNTDHKTNIPHSLNYII